MNKTITLNVPHRLSQAEARARIQQGIADVKTKYAASFAQVEEKWAGDRMEFRLGVMGQAVTGRAEVLADAVRLDIDLPWVLAMLAEKIRPNVEQEARKMLEKK